MSQWIKIAYTDLPELLHDLANCADERVTIAPIGFHELDGKWNSSEPLRVHVKLTASQVRRLRRMVHDRNLSGEYNFDWSKGPS